MAERRAAMVARQTQAATRFSAPPPRTAYETFPEWRWTSVPREAAVWERDRVQPPRVEPFAGENERRLSVKGPSGSLLVGNSGSVSAAPQPPEVPRSRPEGRAKTSNSKGASSKEGGEKINGEYDHLPFGEPVPGKTGYVRLTGKHSSLPEIDVRGIASGTPVEIPDPEEPGESIQFRVP